MANFGLNLRGALGALCAKKLGEAGFTVPAGSEERILAYLKAAHMRIERRPRQVHKASNYAVPPAHQAGEQQFVSAAEAGADLRPYQTLNTGVLNYDDAMLNDFGVQHFHMGTTAHPAQPAFKARTGPLLFAVVRPDDIYLVGCYEHGSWAKQEILDQIHRDWPFLLADYAAKGVVGLSRSISDDDLKTLRRGNVNTLTQRPDGTIHMGPGGGMATDGTAMVVSLRLASFNRWCDQLDRQLKPELDQAIANGSIVPPVTYELIERHGRLIARINGGPAEVDLGRSELVAL